MSNEKQESLADIVAEMRQGMNPNGTAECQYLESDICTLTDRIEAAAKREREAVEADALTVGGVVEAERHKPGNAAAIREALEAINCIDTRRLKRLLCELVEADIPDGGQINKTISAVDKAKAALAAPARNCDRFGGDYKMLHTAWWDWTCSPSGTNPDGTVKLAFGEWLLAPAIKKGGAK